MTTETERLIEIVEKTLKEAERIMEQAKRSLKGIQDEATCGKAHNLAADFNSLNLTVFEGVRFASRLLGKLS